MDSAPNNPLNYLQGKNREFVIDTIRENLSNNTNLSFEELLSRYNEEWIFYNALKYTVATASMVCAAFGIKQKNTCRYKRRYEESGLIAEIKKERCPITGYRAWFLTSDENLFPTNNQLQLF